MISLDTNNLLRRGSAITVTGFGALLLTLLIITIDIDSNIKNCTSSEVSLKEPQLQYDRLQAKVQSLHEYTAFYIFEGANVILVDKRPKYNAVHLNGEQLVTITNFTHK
jgi:hypothetical protein